MTLKNFDDLLKQIGSFGRAQLLIFLVPAVTAILGGFHTLSPVYLFYMPKHRCRTPLDSNFTGSDGNVSLAGGKCHYFHGNESDTGPACQAWVYDTSEFSRTFVTEFNLVCGNATISTVIKTCTFAGFMVGVFVAGFLSDLLGRRCCLISCLSVCATAAIGSAFCQSPLTMAVARFFIGCGALGAFTVSFVIGTEIVGPEARFHTGMAIEYFWSLGCTLMAGLAYLINDWRHLQLAISLPVLLALAAALPKAVVPESPRWLLQKGRIDEARSVIRRMARMNRAPEAAGQLDAVLVGDGDGQPRRTGDDECEDQSEDWSEERSEDRSEEEPRQSRPRLQALAEVTRQLFCQAPRLLAEYCIIGFNWFSISLVYYGLTLGSGALPGSVFVTSLLTAAVEFPAYFIAHASVNRLGRKAVYVTSFFLAAAGLLGLLIVVVTAPDLSWLIIALSMLGKLFSTIAFGVVYLWTAELYPTSIRNIGVSTSSMCARIASLFAPALADIQSFVPGRAGTLLAYSIFSAISIAAALLALLVPETGKKKLPDSLEQLILIRAHAVASDIVEKDDKLGDDETVGNDKLTKL